MNDRGKPIKNASAPPPPPKPPEEPKARYLTESYNSDMTNMRKTVMGSKEKPTTPPPPPQKPAQPPTRYAFDHDDTKKKSGK